MELWLPLVEIGGVEAVGARRAGEGVRGAPRVYKILSRLSWSELQIGRQNLILVWRCRKRYQGAAYQRILTLMGRARKGANLRVLPELRKLAPF